MHESPHEAAPIRVFLLDDHEIVRRGVRDLLQAERDIAVVGESGSALEAAAAIVAARPDVAVLDIQLDEGSGIDVCQAVHNSDVDVACLMLTSYADEEAMLDSVLAGAVGFVLKQVRGNALVDSIRAAAAGRSLIDEDLMVRARRHRRDHQEADDRLNALTGQERKVLDLLTAGLSNREIGDRLFLAEKTVKNYVSNVLMKLGMKSRTEAAVWAQRHLPPS